MPHENLYTPNCIRTYTGIYFNVLEPRIEDIRDEDIAHALSMQCRWGGHLKNFYSVAQHSLKVAGMVPRHLKLAASLHDASDTYLVDVPSPAKLLIPDYKVIEDRIMIVIAAKYGFEWPMNAIIKAADKAQLQWEWDNCMLGDYKGMPQHVAKGVFLGYLKSVMGG